MGAPQQSEPTPEKAKVLFVCIGNSCRSQFAEAIARHVASDVMDAESAGTAPLGMVALPTLAALQEMGIRAEGLYSKSLADVHVFFDPEIVVNMSGRNLNGMFAGAKVIDWRIEDPYGSDPPVYRRICAEIENRVKELADSLRKEKKL